MPQTVHPVIPVLDLMIGQVVLAQGGDRGSYAPVHSRLTSSSQPLEVAKAMFNQTGCDCIYLADIDSFSGAQPNWSVYNELLDYGFGLWVDADWVTNHRVTKIEEHLKSRERFKVIISSETLSDPEEFETFSTLKELGIDSIFSLDKKADNIITQPGKLEEAEPLELAKLAYEHGVREMIVLDLDAVGTKRGCQQGEEASQIITSLNSAYEDLCIVSGGGIRGIDDIRSLLNSGCKHVLVATAIHECQVTPFDLADI